MPNEAPGDSSVQPKDSNEVDRTRRVSCFLDPTPAGNRVTDVGSAATVETSRKRPVRRDASSKHPRADSKTAPRSLHSNRASGPGRDGAHTLQEALDQMLSDGRVDGDDGRYAGRVITLDMEACIRGWAWTARRFFYHLTGRPMYDWQTALGSTASWPRLHTNRPYCLQDAVNRLLSDERVDGHNGRCAGKVWVLEMDAIARETLTKWIWVVFTSLYFFFATLLSSF